MTIGIPCGLLYYYYQHAWRTFFESLGAQVVISGATTKEHMDLGVLRSPPEACVPVKVFTGHVAMLAARPDVDAVFIPRHCSVEPKFHFCPKLMGLPDMIRHTVPELGHKLLLEPWIALRSGVGDLRSPAIEVAKLLGAGRGQALRALDAALAAHRAVRAQALADGAAAAPGRARVAVLGYPYNVYDRFLAMDSGARLRAMGLSVITLEMTDYRALRGMGDPAEKALFWTFSDWLFRAGRHLMATCSPCASSALASPGATSSGAATHEPLNMVPTRADGGLLTQAARAVRGVIHITSFGCGPDAIVGKLLDMESKKTGVPFLTMRIDEHTGESHLLTRLEAFADVVLEGGALR